MDHLIKKLNHDGETKDDLRKAVHIEHSVSNYISYKQIIKQKRNSKPNIFLH